jgi:hypothetical protein
MKIKSIQKGSGEYSIWFKVGEKYARIQEELKPVRWGEGTKYEMVVYRVYDHEGRIVAEVESNSSLLIKYMY